ncbi:unnamed protein product [marine sediment metagenome]|uniref:Uncharacterized protein n=1 Tax=marine sediment metagenome TaxID=412755 RepID=X1H9P8_9ZZZZ
MKGKIEEEKLGYDLLKLFCYIITSARGCVEEPKPYGPFRLIDSAGRIIALLDNEGLANDFLRKERAKIEDNKYLVMQDREKFMEFLDELVMDFTTELKEKKGGGKEVKNSKKIVR